MLKFNVYTQNPAERGTPLLQKVYSGEADTGEQAWKHAKLQWKNPVLEFPEVCYRQVEAE